MLVTGLAIAIAPSLLGAQNPTPGTASAFEVVSIKPNRQRQGPSIVVVQPGGRLVAANTTPRELILVAYGLQESQLANVPDWADQERFAVEARTSDATPASTIRLMIRAMLAERFGLSVHSERRDLAMLALVKARSDGRLGPGLRPSGPECAPIKPPAGIPIPPPPPPAPPGGTSMRIILPTDEPLKRRCGALFAPGWFAARNITMKELASALTQMERRIIVDETGLSGDYDFDLTFMPDNVRFMPAPPPGGGPPSDAPSLPTALREELGLRLDSRRSPVDVLVVDGITRPSEN
jgi:uncharacterized protein (TIGR03435 family)